MTVWSFLQGGASHPVFVVWCIIQDVKTKGDFSTSFVHYFWQKFIDKKFLFWYDNGALKAQAYQPNSVGIL